MRRSDRPHSEARLVFALLLVAAISPQRFAEAQGTLRGKVVDSLGIPIPWANILVDDGLRGISTRDGEFSARVESKGAFEVTVRRLGFRELKQKFSGLPDTTVTLILVGTAQNLSPTEVRAEPRQGTLVLRGFYERMVDVKNGIGHGYFITPEEIDRHKTRYASQLLYGIPAVKLQCDFYGKCMPLGINRCVMTVYLDGMRLTPMNPERNGLDAVMDDWVQPASLAGIEVYPRAVGAPPKYQTLNGNCGVVLLWTK